MASELRSGEAREADVVDLAHDGRGIARIDGKTVFVDGALPGERVRLSVFKRRRTFDEASLVEVLTASPDRVTPACAHFGVCGGCSLQHLSPAAQLDAKQRQLLDNLERIGRVKPRHVLEPIRGPAFGYRRRARLGVKYVHKKGRVLAGFREREKPYIAELRRCETLIERFATLPEDLAALVEGLSIRDKVPQVEVAAGDGTAALVFRVLEPPTAEDLEQLEGFGRNQRVAIYLQSGGLDTIRPLGKRRTLDLHGGRRTGDPRVRARRFHPGESRHQHRHDRGGDETARTVGGRSGARPVLRTGQFHAADRAALGRRGRGSKGTARWWPRPGPTPP